LKLAGYLDQEKLRKAATMSTAAAQLQAQNYSIEDKKLEFVLSLCLMHISLKQRGLSSQINFTLRVPSQTSQYNYTAQCFIKNGTLFFFHNLLKW